MAPPCKPKPLLPKAKELSTEVEARSPESNHAADSEVTLRLNQEKVHLFDPKTEQTLR